MKTNHVLKFAVMFVALGGAVVFVGRHSEAGKATDPTATNDILQFTSSGHVLGFAMNSVYVANGSHALRVEFVNARSTNPVGAAAPSDGKSDKKATPLSQVTYPNLWDGVP